MEEVSLTDAIISDALPKDYFDYGDTPKQDAIRLEQEANDAEVVKNACLEIMIKAYGRPIQDAQNVWAKNGYGMYEKYVTQRLKLSISTAKRILKAYELTQEFPDKKIYSLNGEEKNLTDLGLHKMRSIMSLPENVREDILDSAPLLDLNHFQVEELVKKAKKTGEYNEELLKEVQQKNQVIKISKEQQEKQQQTIQELQAKIQALENKEMQPVAQIEPQVVEKIVEVEKVVEKEVVPEIIQNELDRLREEIAEKDDRLNSAKITLEAIATQQNSKFGIAEVDWKPLSTVVNHFLKSAGEFTYLKEAFKETPSQGKSYVKTQVDRIEQWVIEMKRMMNSDLVIGSTIFVESNIEVLEEEN